MITSARALCQIIRHRFMEDAFLRGSLILYLLFHGSKGLDRI